MPRRSFKNFIGRRLIIGSAVFVVTAGLLTAVLLDSSSTPSASASQVAATLSDELATSDEVGTPGPDHATMKAAHAKLRADLKAARHLQGSERKAALDKIRADVKAGKYGEGIEKRFAHRFRKHGDRDEARHAAFFALLPDELQADLTKARAAEPDERKQMLKDIRAKALAGDYGDKVKKAAELLKGKPF